MGFAHPKFMDDVFDHRCHILAHVVAIVAVAHVSVACERSKIRD